MADDKNGEPESDPRLKNLGSLFVQLVLSFHAAAWQQMGKVVSVITGEIERDLNMAKHSIDMLGMLEEKTRGNLTEDEQRYLARALYELRMNYLDELKKGPDKEDKQADSSRKDSEEDRESTSE
jgi:hypothetical protein